MGKAKEIGNAAEDFACKYLQQQGLKLLARNYHCRMGELDLIMIERKMNLLSNIDSPGVMIKNLVFVEVRVRHNKNYGTGAESVTFAKQSKLIKTAFFYLQQKKLMDKIPCRFDVLVVASRGEMVLVEWIKNAFTA